MPRLSPVLRSNCRLGKIQLVQPEEHHQLLRKVTCILKSPLNAALGYPQGRHRGSGLGTEPCWTLRMGESMSTRKPCRLQDPWGMTTAGLLRAGAQETWRRGISAEPWLLPPLDEAGSRHSCPQLWPVTGHSWLPESLSRGRNVGCLPAAVLKRLPPCGGLLGH